MRVDRSFEDFFGTFGLCVVFATVLVSTGKLIFVCSDKWEGLKTYSYLS